MLKLHSQLVNITITSWIALISKRPVEIKMHRYPNVTKNLLKLIYEDLGAHIASPKSDKYYN